MLRLLYLFLIYPKVRGFRLHIGEKFSSKKTFFWQPLIYGKWPLPPPSPVCSHLSRHYWWNSCLSYCIILW